MRLAGDEDRAAFAAFATAHRLAPLVHHSLPPGSRLRTLLAAEAQRHMGAHLLRERWVPGLLARGRDEGVAFIAMKGVGVAHIPRVYPEAWLRPMADVDLLVREAEMPAALRAAESLGFRLVPDDPAVRAYALTDFYHAHLEHPTFGVLEIHHQLYRDVPPGVVEAMIARSEETAIYGAPARRLAARDLFLVLAVHFAITPGEAYWIWLVDLARLGDTLEPEDWPPLRDGTLAMGAQVFVVATLAALEALWGISPAGMPADFLPGLEAGLAGRERRAISDLLGRIESARIEGDRLSMARRLSGRPVRGPRNALTSLFCHPGAVVMETGVGSDSPFFWWHRLRHAAMRLRRGLAGVRDRRSP